MACFGPRLLPLSCPWAPLKGLAPSSGTDFCVDVFDLYIFARGDDNEAWLELPRGVVESEYLPEVVTVIGDGIALEFISLANEGKYITWTL